MNKMDNLEELKSDYPDLVPKIECLVKQQDHNTIVKKLQEIGAILLTQYEVQIGNEIIQPLRLEAYYYNPVVGFEDKYIHHNNIEYGPKQRNHFGGLYSHPKRRSHYWAGIDIVLSFDDSFALSYLIKNSRVLDAIHHEPCDTACSFVGQMYLGEHLEKMNPDKTVWLNSNWLKSSKNSRPEKQISQEISPVDLESPVFNTLRTNLALKERIDFPEDKQKYYKNLSLGIVTELNNKNYKFNFECGHGKEWMVKTYIDQHPSWEQEKKQEFCKTYLGYCLKEYKNK